MRTPNSSLAAFVAVATLALTMSACGSNDYTPGSRTPYVESSINHQGSGIAESA